MQVNGLFHYLVSAPAPLLEECKAFYEGVLGLVAGPRPATSRRGYWLYAGDQPIVHLAEPLAGESPRADAKGHFDHVAFHCTDLEDGIARLDAMRVPYRIVTIENPSQVQLVIQDPAGIVIELNFKGQRIIGA